MHAAANANHDVDFNIDFKLDINIDIDGCVLAFKCHYFEVSYDLV